MGRLGAKNAIPDTVATNLLAWYHEFLSHPGTNYKEQVLSQQYNWPRMSTMIAALLRTCDECQRLKKQKKKYGFLPVHPLRNHVPWEVVAVDLIGPYTIKTADHVLTFMLY